MSSNTIYTPELVRSVVDDLDTKFRQAIATDTLKEVFAKERNAMVSIFNLLKFSLLNNKPQNSVMRATRETREMPAIQAEFNVPRFLWKLIADWYPVKHDKIQLPRFWGKQVENLKQFDLENPNQYRLGGTPPGPRPSFPNPTLPLMMPKGIVNPPAPAPVAPVQDVPVPPVEPVVPVISPIAPVPPVATVAPVNPPAAGPSTSKEVIDLDEDEDAEGSDDREHPPAPVPILKKKSIKSAPAVPPALAPVPRPRMKKVPVPLAPVPVTNKGKEKMTHPAPKLKKVTINEPAPEVSDDSVEEWPVKRPVQKSSNNKEKEPAPDSSDESMNEVQHKRPAPKSGDRRDPPCKRCKRKKRTCYNQLGGFVACIHCAHLKMKCEPKEDSEEHTTSKRPLDVKPVQPRKNSKNRALEPGPVPSTSHMKPAPSGSRKKKVTSSAMVVSDDDFPQLGPVAQPVASGSRTVDTPVRVNTGFEHVPPADANTEGDYCWPPHRRNFAAFESYYGESLITSSFQSFHNSLRIDVRIYKVENVIMRLGQTTVECIETAERLEERLAEEEFSKQTWLEKNVAAEGEVTILRERVDQQDQTIRRLEEKLDRAVKLIQILSEPEQG